MAIITLTTDLGLKDHYVSAIKGAILKELPDVTMVDISHQVATFNIQQGAYILKNSYLNFPEQTVHIIGINAEYTPQTPHIAAKVNGHYFIGSDNGIFSLIFDQLPDTIVELTRTPGSELITFPVRDIFVKAACHLARGGILEILGKPKSGFMERMLLRPVVESNAIRGTITYIDSYFNIITNINLILFKEIGKGKPFVIRLGRYEIEEIHQTYTDVVEGEIVALFNSAGFLEVAINKGNAAHLLNLQLGDITTITFE